MPREATDHGRRFAEVEERVSWEGPDAIVDLAKFPVFALDLAWCAAGGLAPVGHRYRPYDWERGKAARPGLAGYTLEYARTAGSASEPASVVVDSADASESAVDAERGDGRIAGLCTVALRRSGTGVGSGRSTPTGGSAAGIGTARRVRMPSGAEVTWTVNRPIGSAPCFSACAVIGGASLAVVSAGMPVDEVQDALAHLVSLRQHRPQLTELAAALRGG